MTTTWLGTLNGIELLQLDGTVPATYANTRGVGYFLSVTAHDSRIESVPRGEVDSADRDIVLVPRSPRPSRLDTTSYSLASASDGAASLSYLMRCIIPLRPDPRRGRPRETQTPAAPRGHSAPGGQVLGSAEECGWRG